MALPSRPLHIIYRTTVLVNTLATDIRLGSTWQYYHIGDEYYLHLFAKEQPDLNWENPKVRTEVHNLCAYGPIVEWMDFDAIIHYANGPRLHEYLHGIGQILREYGAFRVGEMFAFTEPNEVIKVVAEEREELNMIFHFDIVNIDHSPAAPWLDALYLENHDQGRSVSRFTSDKPEVRSFAATMLATFLGLQSGTVFIYKDRNSEWPTCHRDENLELREGVLQIIMAELRKKCRDNSRIPMQWNGTALAGFRTAQPWVDVMDMCTHPEDEQIFAYAVDMRIARCSCDLVITEDEYSWTVPGEYMKQGKVLLSNYGDVSVLKPDMIIRPFEAIVYLVD
ncbi:glycoside hydrolase superfamily [Lipomyces kononenkoae]